MPTVTAGGTQIFVCVAILLAIACATWWKVRGARGLAGGTDREMFLAGKGLAWPFVAGAITLTNLSTDQLVGMNGNQMLLLAWWEIAGFAGLLILAFVFVPIYYRYNCTTVTELLERRYTGDGRGIRQLVSGLFLFGNILIYLPAALYSGALFMRSLWGADAPLLAFAAVLAAASAAYTILGGLRAVAVMDTYSGVGVLALALLIVLLALAAVDFDLSGVPPERLTMIGAADSPIPFHTLFTGMILIQIFYWSTNQNITQKAMAAPTMREARKGVLVAAGIRLLVVPPIVVVPGVVAYQLFGDIGDAAYGRLVGEVLPGWLAGAFAAMVAAAVITTFSAVLNSSVALYKVDFHDRLFPGSESRDLNRGVSALLTVVAIALVPLYQNAESIINLLQQLNGLLSMPILSAFVAGLLFRGVDARAAIAGVVSGVALYGAYTFALEPAGIIRLHYIDFMVLTLLASVLAALGTNLALGGRARLAGRGSRGEACLKR